MTVESKVKHACPRGIERILGAAQEAKKSIANQADPIDPSMLVSKYSPFIDRDPAFVFPKLVQIVESHKSLRVRGRLYSVFTRLQTVSLLRRASETGQSRTSSTTIAYSTRKNLILHFSKG